MSVQTSSGWQVYFPEGLSRDEAARIVESGIKSGPADSGRCVDPDEEHIVIYDRATVEWYRHILRKIVDGSPLSDSERIAVDDHIDELERWADRA